MLEDQRRGKNPQTLVFDSDRLFYLARLLATSSEDNPQLGVAAVVMAAAGIEGFVNELGQWAWDHSQSLAPNIVGAFAETMREAEEGKAQLHLKIQLVSALFAQKPFDRGSKVYQDFDLLIKISNAVVHLKVEKYTWNVDGTTTQSGQAKLVEQLGTRKLLPPNTPSFPWMDALCNPAVARWANLSALAMAEALIDLVPQGPFKLKLLARTSEVFTGARVFDKPILPDPPPG
jgi:hypothetical protein